jgi:hypothetical protein
MKEFWDPLSSSIYQIKLTLPIPEQSSKLQFSPPTSHCKRGKVVYWGSEALGFFCHKFYLKFLLHSEVGGQFFFSAPGEFKALPVMGAHRVTCEDLN